MAVTILRQIKHLLFVAFTLFYVVSCKKDTPQPMQSAEIDFKIITSLPSIVEESSGLIIETTNQFWSHNDKGGDPELYSFDATGLLLNTLTISNASNIDWEDMAHDQNGNIYVSDSGNNDNDRQDLRIYKINNIDLEMTTVSAEVIKFTLSNQNQFPPSNDGRKYDIESIIATSDSLYLFTRDRTNPFLGETNLYVLPQTAGDYVAQFKGTFQTDSDEKKGAIRGAAISPDGNKVVLLSKTDIWVFTNFTNNDFFNGEVSVINLSSNTQKEGIDFLDNCIVYISDEKGSGGGKLYSANTCL